VSLHKQRADVGPILHAIERVPNVWYVAVPGQPLSLRWPNGKWTVAKYTPILPPSDNGRQR
jgi:hypothetical protein